MFGGSLETVVGVWRKLRDGGGCVIALLGSFFKVCVIKPHLFWKFEREGGERESGKDRRGEREGGEGEIPREGLMTERERESGSRGGRERRS